jgi:hypothetical protein
VPWWPWARVPAGEGLIVVTNAASGTSDRVRALPDAEVVVNEPMDVRAESEKAATRVRALGVCGGGGTVNTVAEVALRPPRL